MMKRSLLLTVACALAFAAGFASHPLPHRAAGGPSGAAQGKSGSTNPTGNAVDHRDFSSILATDLDKLFHDLARDPFLELSDAELELMANRLDLTSEETRLRLNSLTSLTLRNRLWTACVRANYGKLPLGQLIDIATRAHVEDPRRIQFDPIFDSLEAKGEATREFFATPDGTRLLDDYLKRLISRDGSLAQDLAVVPPGPDFDQTRDNLLCGQYGGKYTATDFATALESNSSKGGGPNAWSKMAGKIWKNGDAAEQKRLLDLIAPLPAIPRDMILSETGKEVEQSDTGSIVTILGMLGSYSAQKSLMYGWRFHATAEQRQELITALEAQPDTRQFQRILELFRAAAEGKE